MRRELPVPDPHHLQTFCKKDAQGQCAFLGVKPTISCLRGSEFHDSVLVQITMSKGGLTQNCEGILRSTPAKS